MQAFFEHLASWTPEQLIALAGILVSAIVLPIAILCWRSVRLKQAESAWRLALLQKGYSVEELERLLPALGESRESSAEAISELTYALGSKQVAAEVIEEVLDLVRRTDAARRQTVAEAVTSLLSGAEDEDGAATSEQILAAVRGLCGSPSERHVGA